MHMRMRVWGLHWIGKKSCFLCCSQGNVCVFDTVRLFLDCSCVSNLESNITCIMHVLLQQHAMPNFFLPATVKTNYELPPHTYICVSFLFLSNSIGN